MEEESCRCGDSIARNGRHYRPYQSMNNTEGLGIGEYKEYKGRVKAVLDFQKKPVHCELGGRFFFRYFGHSLMVLALSLRRPQELS